MAGVNVKPTNQQHVVAYQQEQANNNYHQQYVTTPQIPPTNSNIDHQRHQLGARGYLNAEAPAATQFQQQRLPGAEYQPQHNLATQANAGLYPSAIEPQLVAADQQQQALAYGAQTSQHQAIAGHYLTKYEGSNQQLSYDQSQMTMTAHYQHQAAVVAQHNQQQQHHHQSHHNPHSYHQHHDFATAAAAAAAAAAAVAGVAGVDQNGAQSRPIHGPRQQLYS